MTALPRVTVPTVTTDVLSRYGLQLVLLVGLVVLGASNPDIRSVSNLQSILVQASFTGLAAAGMTLLVISGLFDLSVAGIVALCGVVIAKNLGDYPLPLVMAAVLVLGTALGAVNGLIVTRLRFPAFIATYGMLNVYVAVAFILTKGDVVAVEDLGFIEFAYATLFGIPYVFWLLVLTLVGCYLLLVRTRFGRNLRAIGSNEQAGRLAGLPVDRARTLAFCLVGFCTALAAIGLTSQLSSANATMATEFELYVIAVVVVGGTSLDGGAGTLFGTFTAAILFAALNNALNLLGVESYWQYVVTGIVIVLALAVASLRRASNREAT